MAASKQKTEAAKDHVVLAVSRRGLDQFVHAHGPFTKAQAYAYASWHTRCEGEECMVEEMEPACEHKAWIFEGI